MGQQEDGKFGAVKDDKYVENVAIARKCKYKIMPREKKAAYTSQEAQIHVNEDQKRDGVSKRAQLFPRKWFITLTKPLYFNPGNSEVSTGVMTVPWCHSHSSFRSQRKGPFLKGHGADPLPR